MELQADNAKRSRRAITTSEIARLCGVSRTTVSAVLNGKSAVRESTRRKVLECIRRQNYQFGMIARTLVDELSRMVAILVSALGSPYPMMVFRGLSEVLDAEGYHILFHNVRPEDQEAPETLASIHAYRPAGYIVLKGAEGLDSEHVRKIQELGIPVVCETHLEGIEVHTLKVDSRQGMRLGTDHVVEKGHRRVGHLAGPTFSVGAKERKLGFIESLIAHDIPVSEAQIVDAGETPTAGYHAALEILREPARRPTALVCFNDMLAMGVYRAAHELSLNIPEDLSVVGYDGIDFTELFGPPLTTVDTFPVLRGRRLAELLLRVIRNQTGRRIVEEWVSPRLIDRASVRRM